MLDPAELARLAAEYNRDLDLAHQRAAAAERAEDARREANLGAAREIVRTHLRGFVEWATAGGFQSLPVLLRGTIHGRTPAPGTWWKKIPTSWHEQKMFNVYSPIGVAYQLDSGTAVTTDLRCYVGQPSGEWVQSEQGEILLPAYYLYQDQPIDLAGLVDSVEKTVVASASAYQRGDWPPNKEWLGIK